MHGTRVEGLEPPHKPPTPQLLLKGAWLALGNWPSQLPVCSQKHAWVGVPQPTVLGLELLGAAQDRAPSGWPLHLLEPQFPAP